MPYWGINVQLDRREPNKPIKLQVKMHGEQVTPAPNTLNVVVDEVNNKAVYTDDIAASYFAHEIADRFRNYPDALWVEVNVVTSDNAIFGHTELIKEENLEDIEHKLSKDIELKRVKEDA